MVIPTLGFREFRCVGVGLELSAAEHGLGRGGFVKIRDLGSLS